MSKGVDVPKCPFCGRMTIDLSTRTCRHCGTTTTTDPPPKGWNKKKKATFISGSKKP